MQLFVIQERKKESVIKSLRVTVLLFLLSISLSGIASDYSNLQFDKDLEPTKLLSAADLTALDSKINSFNQGSDYHLIIDFDALVKDMSKRRSESRDWEKLWLKERNKATYEKLKVNVGGKKKGVLISSLFLLEKPLEKGAKWKSRYFQYISTGEDIPLYFRTSLAGYVQSTKLKYGDGKAANKTHINALVDEVISILSSDPSNADNYIELGPFAVSYDGLEYDSDKSSITDGDAEYEYVKLTNPVFILEFSERGVSEQSYRFVGTEVSYYFNSASGKFKRAQLKYTGNPVETQDIKFFKTKITAFDLAVEDQEQPDNTVLKVVSGNVDMEAYLDEDKEIVPLVSIKKGLSGAFGFEFEGSAEGLEGSFDFNGITGITVQYKQKNKIVAELKNASLNSEGIFSGDFVLKSGVSLETGVANLEFKNLNLGFEYDLKGNEFGLTEGSAKIHMKDIPNVTGYFVLDMSYDPAEDKGYSLEIDGAKNTNIEVFHMQVSDIDLSVDVDASNFDIKKIEGTGKVKHTDFDAKLSLDKLTIEEGELVEVKGSGEVGYKGYKFEMTSFEYSDNFILCNSKLKVRDNWVSVENLKIDSEGDITVGKISGNIDEGLFTSTFEASFQANKIKGELKGDISGFSLECAIEFGSVLDGDRVFLYDYGYGSLTLGSSLGVPLAPLPVKIVEFGGRFGYNYQLEYKDATDPTKGYNGSPLKDGYVLGLTLGIADISNMLAISGTSIVQFGGDRFRLDLNGTLRVPNRNPFIEANAYVSYQLPEERIAGGFDVDLKIPKSSGFIINASNIGIDFEVDPSKWRVYKSNMSVKVLKVVDLTGNIDLEGSFDTPNSTTGEISGTLSYGFDFDFKKDISIGTYNIVHAECALDLSMSASAAIVIDEVNSSGTFGATVEGNGEFVLTAFNDSYFSVDLLDVQASVYAHGDMTITNDDFSVNGDLKASLTAWGETKEVSTSMNYVYTF